MRVLLDTNIIVHREASTVVKQQIGTLFRWLDRLHYTKCVHPLSVKEIRKHRDPNVVATFEIKLSSYTILRTQAPQSPEIAALRALDATENSRNDTSLLNEVFAGRVDILVTEDRGIHSKARVLGIATRVFTIDDFLEKVTAEHPDLIDYRVLAVRKDLFGNVNLDDPFFDSFRRDYVDFNRWFNRKADEVAYISKTESGELIAFLYLKLEEPLEPYSDIEPRFWPCRRLKIGTFKVAMNGYKLGERFLKIIFDNGIIQNVEEIYVTIFNRDAEQERLIGLLTDWGFRHHGIKRSSSGEELVLVRDFRPRVEVTNPATTFPYMSRRQRKFIVAIYPSYHTELLTDSILRTEAPEDFEDNRANRNALRKVYISRSLRSDMEPGDIITFYRTASGGAAYYTSVATTLGLVESVVKNIRSEADFIALCRKRSVFSDVKLKEYWNYKPYNRPFVVNFLFTHSFPKRPNLMALKENNIIQEAPRGFDEISDEAFWRLIEISHANKNLIID
jgi:predicted nucleic acid-binding protein